MFEANRLYVIAEDLAVPGAAHIGGNEDVENMGKKNAFKGVFLPRCSVSYLSASSALKL